jgi:hypothetical protein
MDARHYIESLPMDRLRELHVSGVQHLEPAWSHALHGAGVSPGEIDAFLARTVDGMCDHLPLTAPDWALTEWALARIRLGDWPRPWVVSLEYGGVGPWFAPVTDRRVLARDIPRLAVIVDKAGRGPAQSAPRAS